MFDTLLFFVAVSLRILLILSLIVFIIILAFRSRYTIALGEMIIILRNSTFIDSIFGSTKLSGKYPVVAYGKKYGIQLDVLTNPGTYWCKPFLETYHKTNAIEIPADQIGLVIAKYGETPTDNRGKVVDCNDFQDAKAFLDNGGEVGKQLAILKGGKTYYINTLLFDVITSLNIDQFDDVGVTRDQLNKLNIKEKMIGIVTTFDGATLAEGEIAGRKVDGHQKFQDPQKFIDAGGFMGLQEEVLTQGDYYLNPWFVEVKQKPLTIIEEGTVGVVVSNVGEMPENAQGLVDQGFRGIWKHPLRQGTHPLNTDLMKVLVVPTNPITLEWSDDDKPATNYDTQLKKLKLRSKDGFQFALEITQIIRILPEDAPKMIADVGAKLYPIRTRNSRRCLRKRETQFDKKPRLPYLAAYCKCLFP